MSLIPKTLLAAIGYLFSRRLPGMVGKNNILKLLFTLAIGVISVKASCQTDTSRVDKIIGFPTAFLNKVNKKTASLEDRLTRQTEKYLHRLAKKEERLKRRLYKIDSATAKKYFPTNSANQYEALLQKLKSDTSVGKNGLTGAYMPYVDSLKTSLTFLNSNPQLLSSSKMLPADVQKSLGDLQQLQTKMQNADNVEAFIQQRKQELKGCLNQFTGLPNKVTGLYNDYSKEGYYYSSQVKAYKDMLNDPDKMMQTALTVLNKVPAFTSFMKKNSMLASLFNLPAGGADPTTAAAQTVAGLQTRDQVMQALQAQTASTGPNVTALVQQNVQSAQGEVNALRDKLGSLTGGGGKGDLDMPDFKPNNQRTKSFFNRLEYGTNIQSTQAGHFFPTTTDVGLSVGYKLNDKNTIGIGASYKIGWGNSINHIVLSNQGAGLRSFLDIKLKGSFYASGGFEYNYQPVTLTDSSGTNTTGAGSAGTGSKFNDISSWSKSGLIGLTKIVSLKSKTFKKTKIQLLWDFLSYQQRPQTQAFKFRVGYTF